MTDCFFDTYALIEVLNGNPSYSQYRTVITTRLNLMEMHSGILREKGVKTADKFFTQLLKFCKPIDDSTFRNASVLKSQMPRGVSYIDCIGYVFARSNGLKFLTGDEHFRNIEGVEFVK